MYPFQSQQTGNKSEFKEEVQQPRVFLSVVTLLHPRTTKVTFPAYRRPLTRGESCLFLILKSSVFLLIENKINKKIWNQSLHREQKYLAVFSTVQKANLSTPWMSSCQLH